jgi:hypothetical protein
VDAETRTPLAFVHIGVFNKNMGVISNEKGRFQLDLSKAQKHDSIGFSMVGYKTLFLAGNQLNTSSDVVIRLQPSSLKLNEVVVSDSRVIDTENFGRSKPTKTTTGESGLPELGLGGEWGVKIFNNGKTYDVESISFHMRFFTVDSALFRINLYEVVDNMPGESILQQDIYVRGYKKKKWITTEVIDEGIRIDDNVIATFEFIKIWYSKKGDNQLFITHGLGYEEGRSYSRASSFAPWEVDKKAPVTMYIKGQIVD